LERLGGFPRESEYGSCAAGLRLFILRTVCLVALGEVAAVIESDCGIATASSLLLSLSSPSSICQLEDIRRTSKREHIPEVEHHPRQHVCPLYRLPPSSWMNSSFNP
jgi:hypothetical protein